MVTQICIDCGKKKPGEISTHGLCVDCAFSHMKESWKQLKTRSGPYYEKWKAGLKARLDK